MDPAVDGWREILQPQLVDLTLLAAFITLALISFFRKSVPLKYVTLVAAVGYLGFTKSTLVSVSDVFRLTDLSMPEFKYSVVWYAFMTFVLVTTVLWGRVYCGRVCAFGAMTQLLDPVIPRRMRFEVPVRVEKYANLVKYGVLAVVLVYYIVTHDVALQVRYVEPFWMFGLIGTPAMWAGLGVAMWAGLGVLLVATLFVRNLYCRFLCPVGAALGIIAQATTVFRIKRWSECKSCKICEKTCEWGAIRGPLIVKSECVRCDDCERLYLDQKKCPHWLILFKRKGNTAVPVSSVD
ncbi:MAG TPA: 4Fe-4S binding protein [Vicinamibacterales bacterium]|nr:4Fe-4S binding protein [Vicinamibacterales bacterium]